MTDSDILQRLQEVLLRVLKVQNESNDLEEFLECLKILNEIILSNLSAKEVWDLVEKTEAVECIKQILKRNQDVHPVQVFGFRLLGNMADTEYGIGQLVSNDIFTFVVHYLQESQLITPPSVLAESFRVVGLITKNCTDYGRQISRCKFFNHVAMFISNLSDNADVVENGVMCLTSIFMHQPKNDFITLKGRPALIRKLFTAHKENPAVQFHLMRLLTTLASTETAATIIEEKIHLYAVDNIKRYPKKDNIIRSCMEFYEQLSYSVQELQPEAPWGLPTTEDALMEELRLAEFIDCTRQVFLQENFMSDMDTVYNALLAMEHLDEYKRCCNETAELWSIYLFKILQKSLNSRDSEMVTIACRELEQVHIGHPKVAVNEEQCKCLCDTIFQNTDDVKIITGSVGALGEILPKMSGLALKLLKNGIHLKVLQWMSENPSKTDLQISSNLFLINLQLNLSSVDRLKDQFQGFLLLSRLTELFCDTNIPDETVQIYCLSAITLLFRDKPIQNYCAEASSMYRMILSKAQSCSAVAGYFSQITMLLISLLCEHKKIASELLHDTYSVRETTRDSSCLYFVATRITTYLKYREKVLAGVVAMAALVDGSAENEQKDIVPHGSIKAVNLLISLAQSHPTDEDLMKHVMKTLMLFSNLSSSLKLSIAEDMTMTTLKIFSRSSNVILCYLIYKLWDSLSVDKQAITAMINKAIESCDPIGVHIFLEMCKDVSVSYNETTPIIAAVNSKNPRIVEHVLWRNVEPQQIKEALRITIAEPYYPGKTDVLGYLLRDYGYRSYDQCIDWCNLELTSLEPEWLFMIMDLNYAHYSEREEFTGKTTQGRKISLASRAAEVKSQLDKEIVPSLLSKEFQRWKNEDDLDRFNVLDAPEVDSLDEDVEPSMLEWSKANDFLNIVFRDHILDGICKKFLDLGEVNTRVSEALRSLYGVNSSSVPPSKRRTSGNFARRRNKDVPFTSINLSNNFIASLDRLALCKPVVKRMGCVTELNLNHNKLKTIPADLSTYLKGVKSLDLSYNKLTTLPASLFAMPLENLLLSHNEITMPEDSQAPSSSPYLKNFDISFNNLKFLPSWLCDVCPNIQYLNMSNNLIDILTENSSGFELMESMDLSHNQISTIPSDFFSHMCKLKKLTMNNNHLVELPSNISKLHQLNSLFLSSNRLVGEKINVLLKLPSIKRLNLACNRISQRSVKITAFVSDELEELDLSHNIDMKTLVIGKSKESTLEKLKVSNCGLREIPEEIGNLTKLNLLDISKNSISALPLTMGNLTDLQTIRTEGLHFTDIPSSISKNSDIIQYLRQKLKKCQPHYRIKLFVVGLGQRGKTSLCNSLTRRPREKINIATVGVNKYDWQYKGPASEHVISIWDFAGQEEFYTTHQCFLSQRGVYLVVFNLQGGVGEVESIKPWLYTIQARAPNSPAIIVGTHLDKATENAVDIGEVKQRLQELSQLAIRKFFPPIVSIQFVNALQPSSANISQLRLQIISTAEKTEATPADDIPRVGKLVKIMGEQVPASFLDLERFVSKYDVHNYPANTYYPFPVLTRNELVAQLRFEGPKYNIQAEDLNNATSFLHHCGVMLHYNDYTQGLDDLYFIQPEWLSHIFGSVITVREVLPLVCNGLLKKEDMVMALRGITENMNRDLIEKLIHIMERFEIVLNLNEDSILIPSKLPLEKAPQVDTIFSKADYIMDSLERVYKMVYTPHGFWSRLISRLSLFATDKLNVTCYRWKCGVYISFLSHEHLFCLVEGISENMVRIVTSSNRLGSDLLGRIVHHIDTLIEEWYKGLLGVSVEAEPFVEYLVPCKVCHKKNISPRHMFKLQLLVDVSDQSNHVACPSHRGNVDIASIAPDVMLQDFGENFLIQESDIVLNENQSLGDGALGSVCVGMYKGNWVAVKIYRGRQEQMLAQALEDFDAHPHYQFRQESSILRMLSHPSIVKFVGVILRPKRCLILELAGYGSLDTVIAKSSEPLSRAFVHRVSLQVAEGLDYLHRMRVIYRDLKPQNVLIISKDLGVPINAKITDFGISRLATAEGLISLEGTNGFMAPNITGKENYDSKVDIFSFGILIRELLTGRRVFHDLHFPTEIANAFKRGDAALNSDYEWPDMRELLNNCIDSNPVKRPTALQLANYLSRTDLLCLTGVYSILENQNIAFREYHVIRKDCNVEVWMQTKIKEKNRSQNLIVVISLTKNGPIKKAEVELTHDIYCISSYTDSMVLAGGSHGNLTIINARDYRKERILTMECNIDHSHHSFSCNAIHSVLTTHDLDTLYVFLGHGNGHLSVFTETEIQKGFFSPKKTIPIDKSPLTVLAQYKSNLLVASQQTVHVVSIEEFSIIHKFDLKISNVSHNHITKLYVSSKNVYIALYNTSTLFVARVVDSASGSIIKMEMNKKVEIPLQLEVLQSAYASRSATNLPNYIPYDIDNLEHLSPSDLRITCLTGYPCGILLGLGNGFFIILDNASLKLQFLGNRIKSPLRVIVPTADDIYCFGGPVVGLADECLTSGGTANANFCSWHFKSGEMTRTLKQYHDTRYSMLNDS